MAGTQILWLSPTGYVTGDATLRVSYPFVLHPSTDVTCTTPGDLKWVSMGLPLPPGVKVEEVIICYEVSNPQSFISQVRLVEMTMPDQATVRHDDPTDLKSTAPASYPSKVAPFVPAAALTLALRLNFQNTSDKISLGAVGVTFEPLAEQNCVDSIADLKALAAGAMPCLTVLGYHTPGDGGGGDFFWDGAFNVDLNIWHDGEDGGVVIRPNGLQPSQAGRWRRLFNGAVCVKWFGANGVTDDTDAIQAAEDVAAAFGGDVVFPPGTYIINGVKATTNPDDGHKYGIIKRSNTRWIGSGYTSSILKLKDNSTSGGADPQMVYANTALSDIGFYRLGFDLNGSNNTLAAQANVAAIWFDGENLEVRGMVVEGCKFYNGPGGTVILVQNRATSWSGHPHDYPLDDVLILNNRFEDNCLSPATNDHSTMNIWARRTRVIGNVFQQTAAVPGHQRYLQASAIEFHGGDGLFLGNVIRSYGSVVIASENFIEPWKNLLVANNVVSDLGLWFVITEVGSAPETKPIDNIVVRGNHVVFNDFYDPTGGGLKAGLMQVHVKPVSYIEVSDNYFEMASPSPVIWPVGVTSPQPALQEWGGGILCPLGALILDSNGNVQRVTVAGTSAAAAPVWATDLGSLTVEASGVAWQNIGPRELFLFTTHLKVSGNTFHKMEFGTWVDNNNLVDQVKNLEFVNNTCLDMQDLANLQDPPKAPEAAGLWADGAVSQPIENAVVVGNRFINEANNSGYKYGIVLGLNIDNLYLGADNVFYNINMHVWERSLVVNWRGPVIEVSSAWDPGSVGAGSSVSADVPVTGAAFGDLATASFSLDVQDLVLSAAVTAADTVTATLTNNTAGGVSLGQGTLFIKVSKKVVT